MQLYKYINLRDLIKNHKQYITYYYISDFLAKNNPNLDKKGHF